MKRYHILLATALALHASPLPAQSLITGERLDLHPSWGNNSPSSLSIGAMIGNNNFVGAGGGLAIGSNNRAFSLGGVALGDQNWLYSEGSIAAGANNYVGYGAGNAAFGRLNNLNSFYTVAIGLGNIVADFEGYYAQSSLVVGNYNWMDFSSSASIVVGVNNVLGSGSESSLTENVALFGRGLVSGGVSGVTIIGRYNQLLSEANPQALFVVGNGSDANNRSNAFRVNTDGTAVFSGEVTIPKIPPQGDVAMGEFGE